jgi:hypothetical protein
MPLAQLYTLQGGDLGPAEEAAAYEQKLWALPEEVSESGCSHALNDGAPDSFSPIKTGSI